MTRKSIFAEILSVSKTSKIILSGWVFLLLLTVSSLAIALRGADIGVVFLVFVQPSILLYWFYWRTRRQFAGLDFVIKVFFVGFFFSTLQSVFFESVLQFLLELAMEVALIMYGVPTDTSSPQHASNSTSFHSSPSIDFSFSFNDNRNGNIGIFGMEDGGTDSPSMSPVFARRNLILLAIYFFLNAFVIAAAVEESMKYFAVHFCALSFPRSQLLRDPDAALVLLITAALGFTTAENLEYVFGTRTSPIPHTSVFVGELFVLAIRILMPVHVICGALQAGRLAKVG